MASSSTSTLTEPATSSRMISSTSSLSSQSPSQPNVARVYKHASQLFLTRRVREALEALEPLLQPGSDQDSNGSPSQSAPIATASRSARIKVWSLYVSILNAIIEMGPEEGQSEFGNANWKELVKRAREGTIWQGVVNVGYNGVEGDVDADVIANLATLLLAHAPDQRLTQRRLETYLSTSNQPPNLDVEGHLQKSQSDSLGANGTSTPRDLISRLKIVEIYALHVLPRNEEWHYAKEFISMSEILDDERKEAFLTTLQNLQDEKTLASKKEAELQRQREQQMEDVRRREAETKAREDEQRRKRDAQTARKDRNEGVEKPQPVVHERADGKVSANPKASASSAASTSSRKSTTRARPQHGSSTPAKKTRQPPPTMLATMQQALLHFGTSLRKNPMILIRFLAFMIALLMALSRQDIRDRLTRTRDTVWDKLKATVGMGVKVSYI